MGDPEQGDIFTPFNGVRDSFFFELDGQICFEKYIPSETTQFQRIIEIMYYRKEIIDGGFFLVSFETFHEVTKEQVLESI